MTQFKRIKSLSAWRKLSLTLWKSPQDPSIYGFDEFNVEPLLQLIEKENESSEYKITLTHAMAKAVGLTLAEYPSCNAIVKWGTLYQRQSVDVFLQVAVPHANNPSKHHLSGVKIANIHKKSLQEIAKEINVRSEKIRKNKDRKFAKVFKLTKALPTFILRPLILLNEFLTFNFGLNLPKLGLNLDPFGSSMVTNVGSLGLPRAYAPLVPSSRTAILIALGQVQKKPWVENEKIVIKPVVNVGVTMDHRVVDGLHAAKMHQILFGILNNPQKLLKNHD